MSLYSRWVFPSLCEFALNRPMVAERRRALLAAAQGNVLEIGMGTGLNLPHYPQQVRRITAVEPNAGMNRKALARMAESGMEVDQRQLGGEQLPFDSAAFDCVVSTFTLCSIAGVQQALAEVYRVLKPGGQFLLLEHGLSNEPNVARWQRRLNGLERLLADNCHLDRDIRGLVAAQPFASLEARSYYLEKLPKTHSFITEGVATK